LPSAPEQPSWNLAQAVAIYAYEARAAALERGAAPVLTGRGVAAASGAAPALAGRALAAASAAAPALAGRALAADSEAAPALAGRAADPGALAAVDRALAEATEALGKPAARRRLFRSLERARLTGREATLWTAMWRAVQARLRRG
jgi:tRNA C32,U32 (ribose-2'-O)-methylase TrmJ